MKDKLRCVQCGEELSSCEVEGETQHEDKVFISLPVCNKPECPNYGLLQAGE